MFWLLIGCEPASTRREPTPTSDASTPRDGCRLGRENTCPSGHYCSPIDRTDSAQCPEVGACVAMPDYPPFEMELPFDPELTVYCLKGSLVPESSHSPCWDNGRFALDLGSHAFAAPKLVLAPHDGTIAMARGGCITRDLSFQDEEDRCNWGYGNLVRVAHASGWFTQLAHLSSILVHPNQPVRAGQIVGIEGNTGAAGVRHVHVSVHHGDAHVEGLPEHIPTHPFMLRTAVGVVPSTSLQCGNLAKGGKIEPKSAYRSVAPMIRPEPDSAWFRSRAYPIP